MMNNKYPIHPGQILTNLKTIKWELMTKGHSAIISLLKCLAYVSGSLEQTNHMIVAAALFERISCLVYRGQDGNYRKPLADTYRKKLFEVWAETPEEVFGYVNEYGVTPEQAEHIHKLVWQAADLLCLMMACVTEQAFVSEYAYSIEYVIRHDGELPKPEMSLLFPTNYKDYHYWEGIAATIRKYDS